MIKKKWLKIYRILKYLKLLFKCLMLNEVIKLENITYL